MRQRVEQHVRLQLRLQQHELRLSHLVGQRFGFAALAEIGDEEYFPIQV
jgi:hypothetical protein